jgi:hypothetical protein
MKEQKYTVEVCQGQVCHFFGKNVLPEITEGVADLDTVTTKEGNCRGNCNSGTNVYLFKGDDSLKKLFTRVNRKNNMGPTTDEVITSIRDTATSDQSENT